MLSNLLTLKRHLLPESWESETNLDAVLTQLGHGVLGAFESYCARKFARVADATFETPADAWFVALDRYPVETVSALALQSAVTGEWEPLTVADVLTRLDKAAGTLRFVAEPGIYTDTLRVTFTGGYWFDTSEDEGEPDTMPAGANAVPPALQYAWLAQCKHAFAESRLAGARAIAIGEDAAKLARTGSGLELLPMVQATLQPYRRLVG
jgi:hypothetical protein